MAFTIEFLVYGRNTLFTVPFSKTGGEKTTTLIPTYEALKGIVEFIYWKPLIKWNIQGSVD
ncbi:CRISPR-associated protein Cas5 [Lysinibacillus xylanilyticus]|uniref:CRISPR-associated protein Cas5 n=1 Tax=Lysinibacillus xylanilyticus TaxID=582475 RepID=UPI0038276CDE